MKVEIGNMFSIQPALSICVVLDACWIIWNMKSIISINWCSRMFYWMWWVLLHGLWKFKITSYCVIDISSVLYSFVHFTLQCIYSLVSQIHCLHAMQVYKKSKGNIHFSSCSKFLWLRETTIIFTNMFLNFFRLWY